jgi:hypothetical protein
VSRGERVRAEAESRYPALRQFFVCYLHGDSLPDYGTPENAIDVAIAESSVAYRQQARREVSALLGSTDDDTRLRRVLNDGLGLILGFRKPREARAFAEEVERKLTASIDTGFNDGRKDRGS